MPAITINTAHDTLWMDDTIHLKQIYSLRSERYWKVTKPIEVELSNGKKITIEEGFNTDLSSVPVFLWSIFPPFGDFLLASIIHDHLYVNRAHGMSRAEADREMFLWSTAINGDMNYDNIFQYIRKKVDNKLRYWAVRLFGWSYWNNLIKCDK